ncbi:DUF2333 family protein [Modicisalibacter coralii]|uniref:DUF2333 family protein n=1 Tax=Modicisalibacter coralii TaxID=2304602 RepID=UPI001939BF24|nr:DUF2333 family protein [Halomonas coralii]
MALFRNRKRRTEVLERPEYGWIWKPLLVLVVLYLIVCLGLGIWWSRRPADIDIAQVVAVQEAGNETAPAARGAVMVATLAATVETLLDKPGGFLHNDVFPPGVWLDNMPSWEYGVLEQARTLTRALPALNGGPSPALKTIQAELGTDSEDWLYPAAERSYAKALGALQGLQGNLGHDGSGFVAEGDGLADWLLQVSQRFRRETQHLLANADDPEALRELGVDEDDLPESTPWFRIDDTFYEARGEAWALTQLLRAARRDYADLFAKADADGHLERLIAELELAQRRVWSPVILNGSGFGIFANHSLVLANHTKVVADLSRDLAGQLRGVQVPSTSAPASASPADTGQGSEQPSTASQSAAGQTADGQSTEGRATDGEAGEGQAADGQSAESQPGASSAESAAAGQAEADETTQDQASADDSGGHAQTPQGAQATDAASDDAQEEAAASH